MRRAFQRAVFSIFFLLALLGRAPRAWALPKGNYLVTVSPSYRDPESGEIEDPGNNEAIGQGMTEKLCGRSGLLEVGEGGEMYLTVRYYLSQFVRDVSFEERSGGSFSSLSFQEMQTRAPREGADNIDEKYGYTDYRMKVKSMDSVFRGKAYVEPMGRNVVYFFRFGNPVPGSGDFVLSQENARAESSGAQGRESRGSEREASYSVSEGGYPEERGREQSGASPEPVERPAASPYREYRERDAGDEGNESNEGNGSGDADAPVTGIPEKPADLKARRASSDGRGLSGSGDSSGSGESLSGSGNLSGDGSFSRGEGSFISGSESLSGDGDSGDSGYRLDTDYDLSAQPMEEARKLTEPLLKNAVGISGESWKRDEASSPEEKGEKNHKSGFSASKLVMLLLLALSAVLLGCFFFFGRRRDRGSAGDERENAEKNGEGRRKERGGREER